MTVFQMTHLKAVPKSDTILSFLKGTMFKDKFEMKPLSSCK